MILSEYIDLSTGVLDKENGVVRDVLICGPKSKRGRDYPTATRRKALPLYDNAPVNLDHRMLRRLGGDAQEADVNRKVLEQIGRVVRPKDDDAKGTTADFEYLRSHQFAPLFEEYVERMPGQIGFSQVVDGRVSGPKGKQIVEDISKVFSVDLVTNPATTKGLFESNDVLDDTIRQSVVELAFDHNLDSLRFKESVMLLFEDQSETTPPVDQSVTEPSEEGQEEAAVPAADESTTTTAAEEVSRSATTLMEELKSLKQELIESKRELDMANCLSAHHIDGSRLTEEQSAFLQSRPDREAMDTYAESLPPIVHMNPPIIRRLEKAQPGDYESQRKSMAKRYGFASA